MSTRPALDALSAFGFTDLEAEVYVFLVRQSPATGYRIAQGIGKPVANTYKAVESLRAKGAVLVDDGESRRCRAVPPAELLAHLDHAFRKRRKAAARALASLKAAGGDDRVYQLRSVEQVYARCRHMLDGCRQVAVLDLFPGPLDELRPALEKAARRGVRVAVKAYRPAAVAGVTVAVTPEGPNVLARYPGQWLNAVADGAQYLLAFLSADGTELRQAVWSGSAYLSWLYHGAIGSELTLAAVQDHLARTGPSPLRDLIDGYSWLFASDVPGFRELIRRIGPPAAGDDAEE
jgi:HTH-type transcriptional regulator, sugar sensing transcriptional regulator